MHARVVLQKTTPTSPAPPPTLKRESFAVNRVFLIREARERLATTPAKPPPPLHTTVVLNGKHATAHSWITDENGNTIASYVDFYEFRDGRWTAIGGVDL